MGCCSINAKPESEAIICNNKKIQFGLPKEVNGGGKALQQEVGLDLRTGLERAE